MALVRWSIAFIFPAAAAAYACSSLDREPNSEYRGLKGIEPINVVEPSDAGLCTPVDAGACSVSYKADIEPMFVESNCASPLCHLDTYQPRMNNADSMGTWENLRRHSSGSLKKSYINPCSTDPDASYIVDNLKGNAGQQMPPGLPRTPQTIDKVAQWAACGAPFN
jgi:hypothetical protein